MNNTPALETINNPTFTQYKVPSHSWLEVPYDLLVKLKIENKITCYSYRNGNLCYLEEDCDGSMFYAAMKEAGKKYKTTLRFSNYEPLCCSYRRYRAN